MPNTKYFLRGHTRTDIVNIRRYTIETWGVEQWNKYESALKKKLQSIAHNPEIGVVLDDVSSSAYRFPLKDHVLYYLKRPDCIVFVGVIPSKFAPSKHLARVKDLTTEINADK